MLSMLSNLTSNRGGLVAIIGAVVAGVFGASQGVVPDKEQIAELGPMFACGVAYLEVRIRPLLVKIAGGEVAAPAADPASELSEHEQTRPRAKTSPRLVRE